jgi:uncharacterized protein (DUF58 family)
MLTPRGSLVLLALLAFLGVGLGVHNPTLEIVGLMLLAWFLVSWLWFNILLRLVTNQLYVRREVCTEHGPVASLWTGRSFVVRVELGSRSRLPLAYVHVSDRVPPISQRREGDVQTAGSVVFGAPLKLMYRIACPAPGSVRFDGLAVHVADLQGFFVHALFVHDERVYRVLPTLTLRKGHIPILKTHNVLPLLGLHPHRRPGTGSELLDLRDYLPGDPPKTIAWKASARRGRLMTKEFDSEVPIRCTLFVDTSNSVRVGGVGRNALGRLVEITAAVAQASSGARDLTGLCLFDERGATHVRPARGPRHLVALMNLLADAAGLSPSPVAGPVERLLPRAYALAQEVYPEFLRPDVNVMPVWLPWWAPQPAYTIRQPPSPRRYWWLTAIIQLLRPLYYVYRIMDRIVAAPLSTRHHRLYRWRKHLSALLSVHYRLAPGGLAMFLEDDDLCSHYLQRFLAEHQIPFRLPFYDANGKYLFASPAKIDVLADAFLRAVARGHDNELFVIMADLLEIGDDLGKVLAAAKVALVRHHQVMIVCPWPAGIALPKREDKQAGHRGSVREKLEVGELPSELLKLPDSRTLRPLLQRATSLRFHRAYQRVRRAFARLGVPVLCAQEQDAVRLILERLKRLRILERGKP